jgi:hypothetical protein
LHIVFLAAETRVLPGGLRPLPAHRADLFVNLIVIVGLVGSRLAVFRFSNLDLPVVPDFWGS